MSEMQGKVVVVTGASSGIGWSTALKFAQEGAVVVVAARSEAKLQELAALIREQGGQVTVCPTDLMKDEDMENLVQSTLDQRGRLDVLVNAAGIIGSGTIENTTREAWDTMMQLNTRSPFYLMQLAMPALIESQGNVVNVSSVTGVRSFPGVLTYCVSKAALDQLTRCAALDVASKGVRINAINPGVVVTNLHKQAGMDDEAYSKFLEHSKTTHPLGRVGTPEEAAELIYFLASPRAGWITGVTYELDGGRAQTCAR
ncbi:MAG: SDR family oxidoreductase [Deltaproteobacteria bacterium]|nr:MAG: SDR family oxidoreductase [Deltaproteobacteria bacterium]